MSLELLTTYYITYLAISVRTLSFLTFVPVFSGKRVPMTLRIALALILSMLVLPMVDPVSAEVGTPLHIAALMGKEVVVGAVLGFMVQLVFMLARVFGRVADLELGFGIAHTIDPAFGRVPLIGQFMYNTVIIMWLALDGHHRLLKGLLGSFLAVPVTGSVLTTSLATHVLDTFIQLFTAALRIGLPFLIPVFLTTVTIGVLARAMPQLNLLIVGIPMKLLAGFAILMLTLPVILDGFVRTTGMVNEEFVQIFMLLQ